MRRRGRAPTPAAAIATGIGMIAFALLYGAMGIFPMRTRWAREDRVVVQKEEPAKFRGLLVLTVAVGGGILVWGILQSRRQ